MQEGLKTVLAAVGIAKFQKVQVGDEIILADRQNVAYVKGVITSRHEYNTIREMLQTEGVKNIYPFLNDDDLEKGIQMYQNIAEFSLARKYGCMAFGIKIVESKL